MNAFYFGPSQKPLYGIYHAPLASRDRGCGLVLCYPMGQEYIRAHRSFQKLAVRFSKVGFHVLRFDYYGCGDSTGNCGEGNIHQWMNDISIAIDEMKDRGRLDKIFLVGLRLGATLAAIIGTKGINFDKMVLWDPIVQGKEYVDELITTHQNWVKDFFCNPPKNYKKNESLEILGFPLTNSLRCAIEKINLLTIEKRPANHVLILGSDKKTSYLQLRDRLKNMGVHCDYQQILAPTVWLELRLDNSLVPNQSLQSIISWTTKMSL